MQVRVIVLVLAVAAGACTPGETPGPRIKYDGRVAVALATLAKECHPIGTAVGEPMTKAHDFTCLAADAEAVIHLDHSRYLRSVQIKLVAPTTDIARARLNAALTPVLDDFHRSNALSHLDEDVPGGINPIPQLELEGFLYQVASQPIDDGERRYVFRVRID